MWPEKVKHQKDALRIGYKLAIMRLMILKEINRHGFEIKSITATHQSAATIWIIMELVSNQRIPLLIYYFLTNYRLQDYHCQLITNHWLQKACTYTSLDINIDRSIFSYYHLDHHWISLFSRKELRFGCLFNWR